jgi:Flp pilus assembly protein TadD
VPEAIDSLRKAISIYPYDERYHAGLALALKRAGRMDQADEEYRAAIELNSQYTDAWMGLTSLLYKEHRYSEALDACKHAIPAAPPYDRPGIQAWLRTLTPLVSGTSP